MDGPARGPHDLRRATRYIVGVALIIGTLSGCFLVPDKDVPSFTVFNDTDQPIEVNVSDIVDNEAAWRPVEPGYSSLVAQLPGDCSRGVYLVVREPQGPEIDRIETDAVCRSVDVRYSGDGRIQVER